jgi:hypothetical protein
VVAQISESKQDKSNVYRVIPRFPVIFPSIPADAAVMNRFIDIQVHCRAPMKGWLAARARGWDGEDFTGSGSNSGFRAGR